MSLVSGRWEESEVCVLSRRRGRIEWLRWLEVIRDKIVIKYSRAWACVVEPWTRAAYQPAIPLSAGFRDTSPFPPWLVSIHFAQLVIGCTNPSFRVDFKQDSQTIGSGLFSTACFHNKRSIGSGWIFKVVWVEGFTSETPVVYSKEETNWDGLLCERFWFTPCSNILARKRV